MLGCVPNNLAECILHRSPKRTVVRLEQRPCELIRVTLYDFADWNTSLSCLASQLSQVEDVDREIVLFV
jgi:hypothetical protein